MTEFKVFNSLTKTKETFSINSKVIKWYTCGPTVYDSAHMGHARTFLTFDIIRRILEHYDYQVFYVMNITDIDDKIIERVKKLPGLTEENYKEKYYQFVKDMEAEFWRDMDLLGIKRPLVITRVTDYIDKIIKYIEKLEENGFAYPSNGSVYFDVVTYMEKGFDMEPLKCVLDHDSDGNPNSSNHFKEDKKDPRDFALWKKNKPGELFFESKWGPGRVGWNSECVVMATDILGDTIDIHSGGIDLIYPHHQCEIQQATAYKNSHDYQWIKYFLHSGHLCIDGKKMSKSLKNFTTIQSYLENIGTAQELRVLFLMHKWDKVLDYSQETMNEAKRTNDIFQRMFDHLEFTLKEEREETKYDTNDKEFFDMLLMLKDEIDSHLKNNFDTLQVMNVMLDTIRETYKYLETNHNKAMIRLFYDTLLNVTNIFGLNYKKENTLNINTEKFIKLGIDLREDVRKVVMENKSEIGKKALGSIFSVLDDFRDNKLKEAGVQVQDRSGEGTKYIF